MRLQDDIDFTTLSWVKAELDATFRQARQALEAFVEDPLTAGKCEPAGIICTKSRAPCG